MSKMGRPCQYWCDEDLTQEERLRRHAMRRYKEQYGLNRDSFLEMLEAQNWRCLICNGILRDSGHGTHVDHDHVTGQVRGILCRHCNLGLGNFRDNPEWLRKAAKYLELQEGKQ